MLRLVSIVIMTVGISSVRAAEPFRMVLTDVEQNIYKETAEIKSSDLTPKSPAQWSVRKYVLHGGKQDGIDVVEVNNGKLRFTVVPTRGMSVYQVHMGDVRLGWDSPAKGVIRYGLKFSDEPGKIANAPASQVEVIVERDAPYRITVRGRVDETLPKGPKLEMWTAISTIPGAETFRVSNTVTNHSTIEEEFGILYHGNYGRPLMENGAKFVGPVRQVTPINDHAAKDVSNYAHYSAPKAGVPEQVYLLRLWADKNDRTKVMLRNAAGDKAVSLEYSVKEMPFFTLWKNPVTGEDGYVTGLEPGTGFPRNRSIERKFGRVPKLAPHQSRSFTIDFAIHAGKAQVSAAAADVKRILAGRQTALDTIAIAGDKPKPKLSDVVAAARTWGPAFTPWHGKTAPDFTLTDITGKTHKLSDYKGKNILIVFWATWCRPCHMEIPHLIELQKTESENDLAILAISNEKLALVKSFVAQAQMNYTVLTDQGTLPSPYNTVNAIPSSFFIDRQGKIKMGTSGLISLKDIKAIFEAE